MNAARPNKTSFNKPAHSYTKRPFQRTSAVRSQYRGPRVPPLSRNFSTVNRKFPTANRKFPTGDTKFSTADMGKKGKAVASALLGRDIKLLDDANMLLRIPRQHNMYSIDLNNIVPHKDLPYLVPKASVDEGMLWHRRLGHLNFKTMNMLVRHNQVRGLPSKCFENNHTCTACLKGKQHKASLTDDFSRCDNRGEFRNKEMDDFCSRKEIKIEFSNARTPQQNGVTERRNRTLIEAARKMLADAKLPVTFWAEAVNTACYV
nr:hypothetical protein [Tanacetum cinerariifolium]